MIEKQEKVNIKNNNGLVVSKKLKFVTYDTSDCSMLYNVYKKWKELCESLEVLKRRTTNFPEGISEIAVSIVNNYSFLNQKSITANKEKISTSFDCFDTKTGDKIQVKACSTEKDLTSFGPRSIFDKLIFVDFYDPNGRNGEFIMYEIPIDLIANTYVNANQTIVSQSEEERRPRTSIKDIISSNNIVGIKYKLTESAIEKI